MLLYRRVEVCVEVGIGGQIERLGLEFADGHRRSGVVGGLQRPAILAEIDWLRGIEDRVLQRSVRGINAGGNIGEGDGQCISRGRQLLELSPGGPPSVGQVRNDPLPIVAGLQDHGPTLLTGIGQDRLHLGLGRFTTPHSLGVGFLPGGLGVGQGCGTQSVAFYGRRVSVGVGRSLHIGPVRVGCSTGGLGVAVCVLADSAGVGVGIGSDTAGDHLGVGGSLSQDGVGLLAKLVELGGRGGLLLGHFSIGRRAERSGVVVGGPALFLGLAVGCGPTRGAVIIGLSPDANRRLVGCTSYAIGVLVR